MFRKVLSLALFLFIILFSFQSEAATNVESLVDKFMSLTHVQQDDYPKQIEGSITVYGSGTVSNVEKPSFFDEVEGEYYKVITELQTTSKDNSYKIVFCFSDLNKVKNLNKGYRIRRAGKLLKITNWGFWVSVWVLVDSNEEVEKLSRRKGREKKMILAEGNDLGPISREGEKYTIKIQNESFTLEKEKWISLVNATSNLITFPTYLRDNHPDIRRAIRPKEGKWMGELYDLIQAAADKEDKLISQ